MAAVNTVVSVGTTSTQVINVTSGSMPTLVVLTNDSDADIYLALGTDTAAVGSGILITSKSAFVLDTPGIAFGKISAITATGTKNLCVSYM